MKPVNVEIGTIDLTIGGDTPSKEICYNYDWSVAPTLTGTAGTSVYILQVSQDNITFFDFLSDEGIVATTDSDNAMQYHYLAWTYVRIRATGGGTGTATFNFQGKSD